MLHGFPPVAAPGIHTLILGSMPGADSLAAGQYYAHPRNAFWPIMGELVGAHPTLAYAERLDRLTAAGIGLWDVIGSCRRTTSLDSAIEEETITVNDFQHFFRNHPHITRICFNGIKAEQTFNRYVRPRLDLGDLLLIRLPSTSPAHARLTVADKCAAWRTGLQLA